MGRPKRGVRLFKGHGSRLLRDLPDNDWINTQTLEGTEGWKKPYLFNRTYAYQANGPNGAQHLYRVEALSKQGLRPVEQGYGKVADEAWDELFMNLKAQGIMPENEVE